MNDKEEKGIYPLQQFIKRIPPKFRKPEILVVFGSWMLLPLIHGCSSGSFLLFSPRKTWKKCKSLCFPSPVGEEAVLSQREVEPEVRASFPMPGRSWDVFIQSGIHTGVPYSQPGTFPGSSWALAATAAFQALLNAPVSAPPKNSHWDGGLGGRDGGQPWYPKAQGC